MLPSNLASVHMFVSVFSFVKYEGTRSCFNKPTYTCIRVQYILCNRHRLYSWLVVAIMLTLVALDVLGSDIGKRPGHVRPPWCFVDRQIADYNTFAILAGMGWRMAAIILCSISYLFLQYQALKKASSENLQY